MLPWPLIPTCAGGLWRRRIHRGGEAMAWTEGLVAGAVRAGGQMHRNLADLGIEWEIIWEYTK